MAANVNAQLVAALTTALETPLPAVQTIDAQNVKDAKRIAIHAAASGNENVLDQALDRTVQAELRALLRLIYCY